MATDNQAKANNDVETIAEDDWGAAMAEQQNAEAGRSQHSAVFTEFSGKGKLGETQNDIDFILDIPVQLTVELGRTKIAIKNLLMDVLVNGCLIAQGEVVVVNDKFGIRLTDIITPAERIRKLNK